MQRLEVSGAVRPLYGSLGVKGLIDLHIKYPIFLSDFNQTGISRQIFEKFSNVRFHENASSGIRVFHADRQTEMT